MPWEDRFSRLPSASPPPSGGVSHNDGGVLIVSFRGGSGISYDVKPAVPYRVLRQTHITGDNVLCKNWFLFGEPEKISSHTHKTGSWYLFGDLFNIPTRSPSFFLYGRHQQNIYLKYIKL